MILKIRIKKSMNVYFKNDEIGKVCSMHEIDLKFIYNFNLNPKWAS